MSDDRDGDTPGTPGSSASGASHEEEQASSAAAAESGSANANDAASSTDPVAAGSARPAGKRRSSSASPAAAGSRPAGSRPATEGSKRAAGRSTPRRPVAEAPRKQGPFSRIGRFLREVVAELRKVIWPTRKELVTYTAVVLVFVTFMVAIVSGLDILFAKGVLSLFG